LIGHVVENGYDVRPRDSWQGRLSQNGYEVKPNDSFDEPRPAFTLASPGKMHRVIVEGEIDCFPTPLFIIVDRIDTLRDE
tara:strand:- start:434 stop:673 length:240 start_codon:yes stop_codon:yes gene_type:complete